MMSEDKYEILYSKARVWLDQHQTFSVIHDNLLKAGADGIDAVEIVKEMKIIYYAKKRQRGTMIILVGSLFLLIGFILTISKYYANESVTYVMYGFTTAGLAIMFYGLYEIFG